MFFFVELDRNYEVYFEATNKSSANLLTIDNLRSLCRKQDELLELFELGSTCHYSLPKLISFFVDKPDCRQLTEDDIPKFIARMQRCRKLYQIGLIRSVGLNRNREKLLELFQHDSCFRYNFTFITLEYLLDKTFLSTNETRYTAMWFLKPSKPIRSADGKQKHTADSAIDVFLEHFNENPKFNDNFTEITALNFLDIRIPTAMRQIQTDMGFVILAIVLIVAVSTRMNLFFSILVQFRVELLTITYLKTRRENRLVVP